MAKMNSKLQDHLNARFSDAPHVGKLADTPVSALTSMLARGSCRAFTQTPVPDALLQVACAAALAAPSKSDLQQRDIIVLKSPDVRAKLAGLVSGQAWVAAAPMTIVFCGNNRRQRLMHDWRGVAFANDHLDAFFNATADAAIALGAFVTAAEAMGLGCCPISAVRNKAQEVSDLLGLPDHVFPVAGLAIGYSATPAQISPRLPLAVTCHTDRYHETDLRGQITQYDTARATVQPYATQRNADIFGDSPTYGWSEDKTRQYALPERADFGAFVRACGFNLT